MAELNEETSSTLDNKRFLSALRLGEQACQLGQETFGEHHPETLLAAYQLARIYRFVERFDEAEALYRETLERRRAVLGERHRDTLVSMHDLALTPTVS